MFLFSCSTALRCLDLPKVYKSWASLFKIASNSCDNVSFCSVMTKICFLYNSICLFKSLILLFKLMFPSFNISFSFVNLFILFSRSFIISASFLLLLSTWFFKEVSFNKLLFKHAISSLFLLWSQFKSFNSLSRLHIVSFALHNSCWAFIKSDSLFLNSLIKSLLIFFSFLISLITWLFWSILFLILLFSSSDIWFWLFILFSIFWISFICLSLKWFNDIILFSKLHLSCFNCSIISSCSQILSLKIWLSQVFASSSWYKLLLSEYNFLFNEILLFNSFFKLSFSIFNFEITLFPSFFDCSISFSKQIFFCDKHLNSFCNCLNFDSKAQ